MLGGILAKNKKDNYDIDVFWGYLHLKWFQLFDCHVRKGKENNSGHKPGSSRHSKSLRMERGSHHSNDVTPPRCQSVGAAGASRIKPGAGHQSPADLERKHSQLVRRPSGIFGGKPALKTPRIDQTTSLFGRLQAALR